MKSKVLGLVVRVAIVALSMVPAAIAQNAITNWNNIAITAARASKAPGSATPGAASIYVAYMQLAVYNAVNAIEGGFEPYKYSLKAPAGSSGDAAAIQAAYETLRPLLPDQQSYLDGQYNDPVVGIASVPDGQAKTNGQMVGHASAIALLALRAGDGLGANVPYSFPSVPVPGVWILTPGATAPQTPWVGQMRPFTFDDPAKFLPKPPPDLGSDTWVNDYNQVKSVGAIKSTERTPQQTEIAFFWTEHTTAQYGRLLRGKVAELNLSLQDTARLFAMAYAASADGIIGCYNAKYHYSVWRPVTAIRNGDIDGNPDTIADAGWTPLATTPAHPEYPSAHSCLTGALADILKSYFGTPNFQISLFSPATNTTHTFNNIRDWQTEMEFARIYAGFHYHFSVVQGLTLGHKVAHHLVHNYFRPVRAERDRDGDKDDSENSSEEHER